MSELTLTQALKEHSHATHDAVDNLVMSMEPFASHDNYRKFLQAQHEFHQTVNPIYTNEKLARHIDGLGALPRLERVKSDMKDLEVTPYDGSNGQIDTPTYTDSEAVGWLYCVEGSNVGAAILYKEAGKIDLKDEFGASHLAAHADGRMPHWRAVKAKIDALPVSDDERAAAMKGADDAFAYFKRVIRKIYGVAE